MRHYSEQYYKEIEKTARLIRASNKTGMCPVCKVKKSGQWADGAPRILCGSDSCLRKWMPFSFK